jgi:hypothetical protein
MRWFYPENNAGRIGLRLGLILSLSGIIFGSFSALSLSGPNSFAAMYQSQTYLKQVYGDSKGNWSLSTTPVAGSVNDMIVHYKYSEKTGNLHATWDGKEYTFTQEPQ